MNEEATVALLTQKNIEEAARSIGIGSATLLRWLKTRISGVPPDRPITVVEILHAARRRAALSRVESNSHESTQQTPSQA